MVDPELLSTSVNLEYPLTLVNPTLSLSLVDPKLLMTLEVGCQDVGIVEESLSQDLERKRQEVIRFHGRGVVALPTTERGVMYVDDWELA